MSDTQPSLASAVPAGLADAGAAALATFAMGLAAARLMVPEAFAVYALAFSLFSAIMVISTQLAFQPAEVRVVERPVDQRLGLLPASLRAGVLPALLGSLLTPLTLAVLPGDADDSVVLPVLATALLAGVISPVQDHIRRMLHAGGRSWDAARVSGVQLVVAVAGIAGLWAAPISPGWVPFGALVIANVASSAVGVVLARRHAEDTMEHADDLQLSALVRSGRWLLVVGLVPNLGAFVAGALVAHLASAEALGHAEVARVVARPIPVVSVALAAVLGPRLMRAASRLDRPAALSLERTYLRILAAATVGYAAIVSIDWWGNPMAQLLPSAYVVSGLVPAMLAGVALNQLAVDRRLELTAAMQERRLAGIEGFSGVMRMLAAASATVTAEFALPISYATMGVIRAAGFRIAAARHLWSSAREAPPAASETLVP